MSEVAQFDDAWARRITERIRYTALGIRDGVDKLQMLVTEAQNGDAHVKLGYPSWTAYLADVFAEAPLRLERDQRREVVAWLAGEGMPTRAIEGITGASHGTVVNDLQVVRNDHLADAPLSVGESAPASPEAAGSVGEEVTGDVESPNAPSPVTVNPETGEVIDAPVVTEHTVTEKTRTVIGRDGKTYDATPKPPVERRRSLVDAAYRANAELCRAIEHVRTIRSDDRFRRNEADIRDALQPGIRLAMEVLADLQDS